MEALFSFPRSSKQWSVPDRGTILLGIKKGLVQGRFVSLSARGTHGKDGPNTRTHSKLNRAGAVSGRLIFYDIRLARPSE